MTHPVASPGSELLADLEFSRLLRSAAILVVDDEPGMRNFLKRALENRCALLEVAGSAEEAEAVRLRYHFDVLLVDIRLPGLSGLEWLGKLRERGIRTHVIYMTAYADLEMAVSALRSGADDFIMKPFHAEQMLISIRHTLTRSQILRENSLLRHQLRHMQHDDSFIGESQTIKQLLQRAQQMAMAGSCMLISGESGTGKSLLSRVVHTMSRRSGPLVSVNCGALQPESAEERLFGESGELINSHKGTLRLMDVEHLSPMVQARLLEALESDRYKPEGSVQVTRLDVRIIATTCVDLQAEVDAGRFRRDLHCKLDTLPLSVPPLREREQDIELLADRFMHDHAVRLRLAPVELLHQDWERLTAYHWPGNVRELRNVMERCVLLGHLPLDSLADDVTEAEWGGPGFPLDYDLHTVERAHIEAVLESVNHNKSAAARILGVSRKTLERKQALWYGGGQDGRSSE